MIFGAGFEGDKRKGINIFAELAERLEMKHQLVLVEVNDEKRTIV